MEFINEEIAANLSLTPEQLEGLKPLYNDHIANLQKTWDGKANENAEGILSGAAASIEKQFGIKRENGEKVADYIVRTGMDHIKSKETEIEKLKSDYEVKLKEFQGGDALKSELDNAKSKLDEALQKYADYDTLKERSSLADQLREENETLTKLVTYGSVKPSFPDTVNPYEAKAKWDEFVASVEKEWEVKLVEGVPTAINRENKFKTEKLEELVKRNPVISELMAGRQQGGVGATQKDRLKIEGVPFEVPANVELKEQHELIKAQVIKEGFHLGSSEFGARYSELNSKINKQKTAAK